MSTVITSIDQLDLVNGLYTYADYLRWEIKDRLEILKGKIFKMSPAPAISHQKVSGNLYGEMYHYFKGKPCKLFSAPFDVVLKSKKGIEDSVIQPDLCVVCDSKKEMRNKYDLYEESGVAEYWVVRPTDKEITQFVLENGKYRALRPIVEGDLIYSAIFPELSVATEDIFRL